MSVADLLRREGMTGELPAVQEQIPADDTPTERIPVVDILRREGRWDRRKASRVAALAAGVTALAGIAVTALTTGQMHDTAASTTGGMGGGYVPIPVPVKDTIVPIAPTTEAPPVGGGTSKAPQLGTGTAPGGTDSTRSTAGRSESGSSGDGQAANSGSLGTESSAGSSADSSTPRTDAPVQSTTPSTSTPPASPPTSGTPSESPQPQQPPANGGGLLGGVAGLLEGLLGGGGH